MGLTGKLVSKINIKSDGNVFHDLFTHELHKVSHMCPEKIHSVSLELGQWGTVGSIINFHFTHDGQKKFAREMIEAVDEKKKSVTYKVTGGDLMEAYKTFKISIDVDDTNSYDHLVTWTLAYEKKTPDVPDPHTLMDFCLNCTKQIERNCLLVPN